MKTDTTKRRVMCKHCGYFGSKEDVEDHRCFEPVTFCPDIQTYEVEYEDN
jgi:hypothetical protein